MKKKFLALVMSGVMLSGLTACGSSAEEAGKTLSEVK